MCNIPIYQVCVAGPGRDTEQVQEDDSSSEADYHDCSDNAGPGQYDIQSMPLYTSHSKQVQILQ